MKELHFQILQVSILYKKAKEKILIVTNDNNIHIVIDYLTASSIYKYITKAYGIVLQIPIIIQECKGTLIIIKTVKPLFILIPFKNLTTT